MFNFMSVKRNDLKSNTNVYLHKTKLFDTEFFNEKTRFGYPDLLIFCNSEQ